MSNNSFSEDFNIKNYLNFIGLSDITKNKSFFNELINKYQPLLARESNENEE
jgi:hypothetical protein